MNNFAKLRRMLLPVSALLIFGITCQNKALEKNSNPKLQDIKMPPGFKISIFADEIENARSLALGDNGTVFVGSRSAGKVYALVDENGDGEADRKYILARKMNSPNGVAYYNGDLYIAEISKIWKLKGIENNLENPPAPELVSSHFPNNRHHGWKYIAFGPDGKLYVPVGAPCNICDPSETDPRYASITRMNPDGSAFEIFAHGIRNTVGFDWHPQSKELWFTDNGRDWLGDDLPPDELNNAPKPGMHFGFPHCHGLALRDPAYGVRRNCNEFTPPIVNLDAHVASLGMKFYTGEMFPSEYQNQIFIAEHGSWNRTNPVGYRITVVKKDSDTYRYEVFADGWLKDGKAWGRPVDVLQLKDGSLLVSDDFANIIYRISR